MTMYLFPLRSTADLAHAARTLRTAAERGEPAAVDLLTRNGLHTDTVSHVAMLEALSREAGLVSYEIARKLLPEAEKTTLELAQALADEERQQVVTAQGQLRFLPDSSIEFDGSVGRNDLESRLIHAARKLGYHCSHATAKTLELFDPKRKAVCYIDRTRQPPAVAVIVAPWNDLNALRSLELLEVPDAERWYHSSNLRCFPRHHHRGKNQIPYGYSITCTSEGSFARLLTALT